MCARIVRWQEEYVFERGVEQRVIAIVGVLQAEYPLGWIPSDPFLNQLEHLRGSIAEPASSLVGADADEVSHLGYGRHSRGGSLQPLASPVVWFTSARGAITEPCSWIDLKLDACIR